MMKSYVSFLEGLYLAILKDVESCYPRDAVEWTRDITRLRSVIKHRGLPFFTIDLPAMGKHLDKCLANGALTPSGLPCQAPYSKDTVIPGLFRGLLRRVFDHSGVVRSNVDTTALRFLRRLYYVSKKLRMECPSSATYKAVEEFFDVERDARCPTLEWDSDDLDLSGIGKRINFVDLAKPTPVETENQLELLPREEEQFSHCSRSLAIFQRVCDWIVGGEFGPVHWQDLRPKHGPGAVADAKVGKESKYSFPHWPAKLERIFPIQEFGYANYNAWESDPLRNEALDVERLHEPPSRLIAVPKTQKGPRLIASEPTAHQWMQQSLKRELERMVSGSILRFSISFASQEPSRMDALESSRHGLRATIDLSSASDRLSCWVVERAFRSHGDLLHAFHAVRTRWLINEIDKKQPKYVKLRKFAPMGSALTFPVQSITYALAAIAMVIHHRQWQVNRESLICAAKQVRVYGDDIIVPVDCVGSVKDLLTQIGLKVNTSKTFSEGFFRESCGVDAYKGVDVTPTYVLEVARETRPESVVSVVASHNNFLLAGMLETAKYLRSTVPSRIRKRIPTVSTGSESFGWYSYDGADYAGFKSRYNRNLHRMEYKVLQLLVKSKHLSIEGWQSLHQYFTDKPAPDLHWMSGISSVAQTSLRLRWAAP